MSASASEHPNPFAQLTGFKGLSCPVDMMPFSSHDKSRHAIRIVETKEAFSRDTIEKHFFKGQHLTSPMGKKLKNPPDLKKNLDNHLKEETLFYYDRELTEASDQAQAEVKAFEPIRAKLSTEDQKTVDAAREHFAPPDQKVLAQIPVDNADYYRVRLDEEIRHRNNTSFLTLLLLILLAITLFFLGGFVWLNRRNLSVEMSEINEARRERDICRINYDEQLSGSTKVINAWRDYTTQITKQHKEEIMKLRGISSTSLLSRFFKRSACVKKLTECQKDIAQHRQFCADVRREQLSHSLTDGRPDHRFKYSKKFVHRHSLPAAERMAINNTINYVTDNCVVKKLDVEEQIAQLDRDLLHLKSFGIFNDCPRELAACEQKALDMEQCELSLPHTIMGAISHREKYAARIQQCPNDLRNLQQTYDRVRIDYDTHHQMVYGTPAARSSRPAWKR